MLGPTTLAQKFKFLTWFGVGGLLLWAYWPTLAGIAEAWATNPQYSHGYLVPVFAVVLLWLRRQQFWPVSLSASSWGFAVLLLGAVIRLAAARYYFEYFEGISLLVCLTGFCLCIGGRPLLRWSFPAIAFLFFMLPLPFRIESLLSSPLRRVAVVSSTYVLQTLSYPAAADGNVILMPHMPINVVDPCNGLSMLLTFFALSTAVALVAFPDDLKKLQSSASQDSGEQEAKAAETQVGPVSFFLRPKKSGKSKVHILEYLLDRYWVDKIILVLSAIPIALIANVLRIVATAIAAQITGDDLPDNFVHDLAGWLMMPCALALLGLELLLLKRLFVKVSPKPDRPISFGEMFARPSAARRPLPAGLPGVENIQPAR
jgi:exosortase